MCPMSSKRKKMAAKRGRASEEHAHSYDHDKFVNESTTKKFGLISKNRSFIKEKGFHHPTTSFARLLRTRGGRHYVNPYTSATSMVREFYTNLASHVLKKVRVRGVLVDFSVKSINQYYNL